MSGQTDPLTVYLAVLFARARPSTLVEVRWRTPTGMGRRFIPAGHRRLIEDEVRRRCARTDVYVGVLPRWRPAGDRRAVVGDGRIVWVDLDIATAARALEPADPAPALAVASGGPGHLHAYWQLARAVPPGVIERANRRLAWALGGDLSSTDAARILRPPGTLHHGREGVPVKLVSVSGEQRCGLGELVGGLPDPPGRQPHPRRVRRPRGSVRDPLLAVAPERYVSLLTGQQVGRGRKIRCPLHDDRTASLHVYPEPERGWFCFGCRRGGSIYDLAAGIWLPWAGSPREADRPLRGREFLELRQRLSRLLAAEPAARR
jgi:hypothetical protein